MSNAKFAPITADLLVRKGDAAPSLAPKRIFDWTREPPPFPDERDGWLRAPVLEHRSEPEYCCSGQEPPSVPDARKARRLVISLTAAEYERLGIAAAKKGLTRHELVNATMQGYFSQLARELQGRCACLNNTAGPVTIHPENF